MVCICFALSGGGLIIFLLSIPYKERMWKEVFECVAFLLFAVTTPLVIQKTIESAELFPGPVKARIDLTPTNPDKKSTDTKMLRKLSDGSRSSSLF